MKVNIKSNQITKLAVAFIIITISISVILLTSKKASKSVCSNLEVTAYDKALTSKKDGNIELEENKYFKKYIINFDKKIEEPRWSQNKSTLTIYLKKDDVSNLSIKSEKNIKIKDVYVNNTDDKNNLILKFKKSFDIDKDGIYIDKNKGQKLIILVNKVKNPYKYKVVIDPGHGGRDPGNVVGTNYEKNETLIICLHMYDKLMYNGCKVTFTRDSDIELNKLIKEDLKKRAQIANDWKADAFVSIHINAGNVKDKSYKKYHGISTHYYGKNNEKQKTERMKLAQVIEDNAVKSDGWNPCKIIESNDSVLRNTDMPSALVECGYMTNEEDKIKLSDENIITNLSNNICEGIIKYLNNLK